MVRRTGGTRRKTRYKLRRREEDKGKVSIRGYFKDFKIGERIVLKINSSVHKGLYHPRYHGRSGVIAGKRGHCYLVSVMDENKEKTLIVHPIHMKGA